MKIGLLKGAEPGLISTAGYITLVDEEVLNVSLQSGSASVYYPRRRSDPFRNTVEAYRVSGSSYTEAGPLC